MTAGILKNCAVVHSLALHSGFKGNVTSYLIGIQSLATERPVSSRVGSRMKSSQVAVMKKLRIVYIRLEKTPNCTDFFDFLTSVI